MSRSDDSMLTADEIAEVREWETGAADALRVLLLTAGSSPEAIERLLDSTFHRPYPTAAFGYVRRRLEAQVAAIRAVEAGLRTLDPDTASAVYREHCPTIP